MPLRKSDHHHKEKVVYDDDPYEDYYEYERPRASRRVSRSAHELDSAEAGRSYRRRSRYEDDISPPRPSARSRSVDHRPPPRGRYDSYDDYSDSYDDRRRRRRDRTPGPGGRQRDSKASGPSSSRTRLQRRESDKTAIIQAAASAAVVAGAAEAWRMRKDKRPWSKKGTKVATAAAGAAAIAAFRDNNPKEHSSKKNAIEATLGGLVLNRLANGGRK